MPTLLDDAVFFALILEGFLGNFFVLCSNLFLIAYNEDMTVWKSEREREMWFVFVLPKT